MAKGSVRKKGKKCYYRFYVEDESGNRVQGEFPGIESKSETESMLRKAMDDYENIKVVAKVENLTVGEMLDKVVHAESLIRHAPSAPKARTTLPKAKLPLAGDRPHQAQEGPHRRLLR